MKSKSQITFATVKPFDLTSLCVHFWVILKFSTAHHIPNKKILKALPYLSNDCLVTRLIHNKERWYSNMHIGE